MRCCALLTSDTLFTEPGEFVCDVHPQELDAADYLHRCIVNEQRSIAGPFLSKVTNDIFSFDHIQD